MVYCNVRIQALGGAQGHVMINNQRWNLDQKIQCWQDAGSPLRIQVYHYGKTYQEPNEVAVCITHLQIDQWIMQPEHHHLAEFCHDGNGSCHTMYLGHNGIWTLDIDAPFWIWHHQRTHQGMLIKPARQQLSQKQLTP